MRRSIMKTILVVSAFAIALFSGLAWNQILRLQALASMVPTSISSTPSSHSSEEKGSKSFKKIPIKENAATYYTKAISSVQYPKSDTLKNRIKKVIKSQWADPDGELSRIIGSNHRTFKYTQKALQYPQCDFYFGKQFRYRIEKEIFQYASLIEVSNLVLLKGKFLEKLRNPIRAKEEYLGVLKMGLHISQDEESIAKAIAISQVGIALSSLNSLVKKSKLKEKDRIKIQVSLIRFKNKFPEPSSFVLSEKDFFISLMDMLVDGTKEQKGKILSTNKMSEDDLEYFSHALRQNSQNLADRYFGNFVKAADSNEESDWSFAQSEFDALMDRNKSKIRIFLKASQWTIYGILGQQKKYSDEITEFLSETLLSVAIPDMRNIILKQHENNEMIEIILVNSYL